MPSHVVDTTRPGLFARAKRPLKWAAAVLGIYLLVLVPLRVVAGRAVPDIEFIPGAADTDTLVVIVHGLAGAPSRNGMLEIVQSQDGLPGADILAPLYFDNQLGALSNADPYQLTDLLEVRIQEQFDKKNYAHVVLVGHSMGGGIMRKALVWALGEDEDRPARRERSTWPAKVDRFVSLAAINRGWSIDPRPDNMSRWRAWTIAAGLQLGALTSTAHFIRALQRGAPYVADLRIQWLRLARDPSRGPLPPTIHLLGTKDDIVNADDSRDLCVAAGVRFVSLPGVGHGDIAAALRSTSTSTHATTMRDAIAGRLPITKFDATTNECRQFPDIERLVFIVHGIRDYADWGETLETEIEMQAKSDGVSLAVEPSRYGFFPMAPFLLRPDRQEKVRWFMDRYTDAVAMYPDAKYFDFIGHSNGTYLLGAALVRYKTLKIRNAYLAGSVLPQRFPWKTYVPRQVELIRNVVASQDWVVGIFPRLFEQLAEWSGIEAVDGFFDVGAAGFRGFTDLGNGSVSNIKYAPGSHGYGVDISYADRKSALVSFALNGVNEANDGAMTKVFGPVRPEDPRGIGDTVVDVLSRVSLLIWIGLVAAVISIGVRLWRVRWWAGGIYAGLVLYILNSI
jgi:pimeloyl-ACP methyl ester carboxylesterase